MAFFVFSVMSEFSLDDPGFTPPVPPVPPPSSDSSVETPVDGRRKCSSCPKRMSKKSADRHTVCITCRGFDCDINNRCEECLEWSEDDIIAYAKYRKSLNCSDRILTCRIKSIRSPAKVGLVVTDLITSSVVSWEGWETPPPQHRGSAVILCSTTGVVRPLCSCGDLLLSSARLFVYVWWMSTGILSLLLSIFLFSFLSLGYVEGFKDLSQGWGPGSVVPSWQD